MYYEYKSATVEIHVPLEEQIHDLGTSPITTDTTLRKDHRRNNKVPNMPPEAISLSEGTCLKAPAMQLEPNVLQALDSVCLQLPLMVVF